MARRNVSQVKIEREDAKRLYDIQAAKLESWKKVGLDFCTTCMSEDLAIVVYSESLMLIRCRTCNQVQE